MAGQVLDGFMFITPRMHRATWRVLRVLASGLPHRARSTALSIASAALLPATLAGWLALQISAFALLYLPGMAVGWFRLSAHLPAGRRHRLLCAAQPADPHVSCLAPEVAGGRTRLW